MEKQPQKEKIATLFIIPTPIGNLGDITLRALEMLKSVDLIAAEDTRQIKKLLAHFEISAKTISFHAGSKPEKIITLLQEGKNIALVSDAGTPAISDPGAVLLSACVKENIRIIPLPGASAFVTALSASAFPTNNFEFLGFLPHKKGRQTLMKKIAEKEKTTVFYESTHRIMKFLKEAKEYFEPTRKLCLAREISKIYEEFLRGSPTELLNLLTEKPQKQKGEFTVMVAPKSFF